MTLPPSNPGVSDSARISNDAGAAASVARPVVQVPFSWVSRSMHRTEKRELQLRLRKAVRKRQCLFMLDSWNGWICEVVPDQPTEKPDVAHTVYTPAIER